MKQAPEGTNKYPLTEEKLAFWKQELKELPDKYTVVWKSKYQVRITWVNVIEEGEKPTGGDLYEKLKTSQRVDKKRKTDFMSADFWPTRNRVTEVAGKAKNGQKVMNAEQLDIYLSNK